MAPEFGRGQVAQRQAQHDDGRYADRRDGHKRGAAHIGQAEGLVAAIAAALHRQVDGDGDADRHQQARYHAAQEHAPHRHTGERRIDHHGDAGRDHRAHQRGRAHHRGGESRAITLVAHRRDQGRSQRRGVGGGRAGDAGQQHAGHGRGIGQAALDLPDDAEREVGQALGDAAARHHFAHQDIKWHRKQRPAVEAVQRSVRDDAERHTLRGGVDPGDSD